MGARRKTRLTTEADLQQVPVNSGRRFFGGPWLVAVVVLVLTAIAYLPALDQDKEFTNWDDDEYVWKNSAIKSFSAENVQKLLTQSFRGNYHPLTMFSLAMNYRFSGENPRPYFAVNYILHLLNTLLVFLFIYFLSNKRIVVAGFVAVFFGVHPMHVESVAWISERKDVLYTFFFLGGLISYHRYSRTLSWKYYLVTLVLFAASLLSKPAAAIFPVVILLLDYWEERRVTATAAIEKLPFLVLSALAGMKTLNAQQASGAMSSDLAFSHIERLMIACYGLVMYLVRLFLPFGLSNIHPALPNLTLGVKTAPILVMATAAFVYFHRKKSKVVVWGLLFYLTNLVLVLQFVRVGGAIIAERYTYVPYIGLLFVIAWGYDHLVESRPRRPALLRSAGSAVLACSVLLLVNLSLTRVRVWKNSETLWSDTLTKYPDLAEAYYYRGLHYYSRKQYQKALADYDQAISRDPGNDRFLVKRSFVHSMMNDKQKALQDLGAAIKINQRDFNSYLSRGNIYFELAAQDADYYGLALSDYTRSLELNPKSSIALGNRGAVQIIQKHYDVALKDLSEALVLDPRNLDAYTNRALIHQVKNDYPSSVNDYTRALELAPNRHDIYSKRGIAKQKLGLAVEAIKDFDMAIQLDQGNGSYYLNRSYSYRAVDDKPRALHDARKAREYGQEVDGTYFGSLTN